MKIKVLRWIFGGLFAFIAPLFSCLAFMTVFVVIVLAGAGGILGWLFGGSPPAQAGGGSNQPPTAPISNWTPTPIPTVIVTGTRTPRPTPPGGASRPKGSPYLDSGYVISQEYGCTDFPEFEDSGCSLATGGKKPWFHKGIDLVATGSNKTLIATATGYIEEARYGSDGFGIRVVLRAGDYLIYFAHMSQTFVAPGQAVRRGDPIGVEGSTGYSTGPHVHYEIYYFGQLIDPTLFL